MKKNSDSHWLEKAAIIAVSLVVLAVTIVTFLPRDPAEGGAELTDVDTSQVKDYLIARTGLEITGIEKDINKNRLTVYYRNDDVTDEDEILFDISNDSAGIIPILLELTNAKSFKVVQLGTFVNNLGESSLEISAALTVARKDAKEIEWKTVNATNPAGLLENATEIYINPEVRTQLDDSKLLNTLIMQLSTH